MKNKKNIIAIIVPIAVLVFIVGIFFAISHGFIPEQLKESYYKSFYKNVTEITKNGYTIKLKDGVKGDLIGEKYNYISYCEFHELIDSEEYYHYCDWHCEAAADRGISRDDEGFLAPSIFDEAEITFPKVKSINEIDTYTKYFSKEDLLAVTVHIGKRLTDKESISDTEVIELLHLYTKHFESTRNLLYQPGTNQEEIIAISYVPNSYKDHNDMRNDLMKLLYDRGLTPLAKECSKYNAMAMINDIILSDYKTGLENIKVLKTAPDEFLYLSVDGDFLCKIGICTDTDREGIGFVSHVIPNSMKDMRKIERKEIAALGASLTDKNAVIPFYESD